VSLTAEDIVLQQRTLDFEAHATAYAKKLVECSQLHQQLGEMDKRIKDLEQQVAKIPKEKTKP
jgi:uncharacterized coiled-coil protein SlyX